MLSLRLKKLSGSYAFLTSASASVEVWTQWQAEKDAVFPLLKPTLEGNVDVNRYTEQDMIIVGTPEECLRKILRYEEAGVDQLLCYMQFGFLPHEKVMRTIALFGTEVAPAVREEVSRRSTAGAARPAPAAGPQPREPHENRGRLVR